MSKDRDWTIGELLDWTAKHFAQKSLESPRLDAEVLLAQTLGCKRIELYTRYTDPATPEQRQKFRELVGQRLEGCPVAYLVGRKEFFSLELTVSRAVLIPRPDTEHVVMECLKQLANVPEPTILDIGTGSGCLAIAITQRNKAAKAVAVDVSPEALAVAKGNAEKHKVADRIEFLEGDLYAPIAGRTFDAIVSNPPYIPTDVIPTLQPGVRDYEPHRALDGGPDGFAVFDRLIQHGGTHLKPGGLILIEIGSPQEQTGRAKFAAQPGWDLLPTIQDYSGHPRVLAARWRKGP